jgi:uncharacterized RDD family membrane protein YckC
VSSQEGSADGDSSADSSERYVGLVTRGIAFAIDAAIIDLVALVVAAAAALIVSIFHFPHAVRTALEIIGVVAYVLWSIGYLVVFWSTTGQTPGCRVMRCKVVSANGDRIGVRRALVRCVGLVLAALPLFAGFLRIPFDRRRRGFHDRLARTVVLEAPAPSAAAQRRMQRLASRAAQEQRAEPSQERAEPLIRSG